MVVWLYGGVDVYLVITSTWSVQIPSFLRTITAISCGAEEGEDKI